MIKNRRPVDHMGRIVIPASLRKEFSLNVGAEVEFSEADGKIVLEPVCPKCRLCGSTERKIDQQFGVCQNCIDKIKQS